MLLKRLISKQSIIFWKNQKDWTFRKGIGWNVPALYTVIAFSCLSSIFFVYHVFSFWEFVFYIFHRYHVPYSLITISASVLGKIRKESKKTEEYHRFLWLMLYLPRLITFIVISTIWDCPNVRILYWDIQLHISDQNGISGIQLIKTNIVRKEYIYEEFLFISYIYEYISLQRIVLIMFPSEHKSKRKEIWATKR